MCVSRAAAAAEGRVAVVLPPGRGGAALAGGGGAARARAALPRHAGLAPALHRLLRQGIRHRPTHLSHVASENK